MKVYLNEFNIVMGRVYYLPLVSGLLRAYAETFESIRANYEFAPFIHRMDSPGNILAFHSAVPGIAAFSVSVWNEQLSLAIAAEVKGRWPQCLIIFGGPQVPHKPESYFWAHPFIDVTVRQEGEEAFADILCRLVESRNLDGIPQVAWRAASGEVKVNSQERGFKKDLDELPSPYLAGLYDEMMEEHGKNVEYQAILETNRGCPFNCSFCFYGRNQHKFKYHSIDKVFAEIDWIGRNRIAYLLCSDSNFGMQHRDLEIARRLVETKKRYGFPDKFRTNFGKNADERIFEIGRLLHEHGMEKGVTLARQSNDDRVLRNIKRGNIKMSTYRNLQVRFNEAGVLTYSEFIVGLPGETMESWKRGLDEMVETGMRGQCLVYPCMALPNTDMDDPAYRQRFGVQTRRVEIAEIHGGVRLVDWPPEYEEIVVSTDSMGVREWRCAMVFSYAFTALHSMKLGYFLMVYLLDRYGVRPSELIDFVLENAGGMWRDEIREYDRAIDGALDRGEPLGVVMPEHGDIYWGAEEATFLRATEDLDRFYAEMEELADTLLRKLGIAFDPTELREVVRYQRMRVPTPDLPEATEHEFSFNLQEYFDSALGPAPVPLRIVAQTYRTRPVDFAGDRRRFAREVVLWGRKSGAILIPVTIENPRHEIDEMGRSTG